MSTQGLFYGFGTLIVFVLASQWVGLISLGKWRRSNAWWCMVSGSGFSTLAMIFLIGFLFWLSGGAGGSADWDDLVTISLITFGLSALGILLFMIGFAFHGLRIGRVRDRVNELEAISAAQARELQRLREAAATLPA